MVREILKFIRRNTRFLCGVIHGCKHGKKLQQALAKCMRGGFVLRMHALIVCLLQLRDGLGCAFTHGWQRDIEKTPVNRRGVYHENLSRGNIMISGLNGKDT